MARSSGLPAFAFVDVADDSPYAPAIWDLTDRGIVSGFDADHFVPEQYVTRQQFAKMIDLPGELVATEGDVCPFPDVDVSAPGELYPDHYVAATAGFTQGRADGTFDPYNSITRAQVITMVVRALDGMHPDLLQDPLPGETTPWGDFGPIHAPNALRAISNGLLMPISIEWVGPWDPMPREEVARLLDNALWLIDFASQPQPEFADVISVLDGDTIRVVWNGAEETVRLLGIDAPALAEPFGKQARDFLAFLVGGKSIAMLFDVRQRDEEGNLLAYVGDPFADEMASVDMLRMGLARLNDDPINPDASALFQAAQETAQTSHLGIWGDSAS
ncbi:MAG: S-layer homology domain-containing protein [Actinobacteria bacterium]|nr:S-layer homology domain-containing protein [Actinomycetota bacterium]